VCGETGTGKELVARILHEWGLGSKAPFVAVNCASVSGELFGSELFGHVKGSFTGALRDRLGHFQVADGGTLFLDELGELPLEMQPKLLRALDNGEILPVGASKPVHVQVRLVAATNRDLKEEIAAGRFRDDLYYRLSVIEMQLPPLRERTEDIPPLSEHLLQRIARRLGRRALSVRREAMGALMKAPLPGNVRELENVLERAAILADGEHVEVGDLPEEISEKVGARVVGDDLRSVMRDLERRHINRVLADTNGNREEAARRLGIDPSTLYRHLRAHDEQE
jgi:DNA-binding NtrC family response regulator